MSAFSSTGLLGELEQLVLLAARRLPDAYAVSIRDEIAARTGRSSWLSWRPCSRSCVPRASTR